MATAYLIGGTPRCGKTSLALSMVKKKPMFSTSTDSLRHIMKQMVSKEAEPYLYYASERFTEESILDLCSTGRASEIVTWQNNESRAVWKSVKNTIEGFIREDLDILIEGVAILPEFLSQLECDVRVVFVGNSSSNHGSNMLAYARSDDYDWLSSYSDEAILKFSAFTQEFSRFIESESRLYGYKYVDLAKNSFDKSQEKAISWLSES